MTTTDDPARLARITGHPSADTTPHWCAGCGVWRFRDELRSERGGLWCDWCSPLPRLRDVVARWLARVRRAR